MLAASVAGLQSVQSSEPQAARRQRFPLVTQVLAMQA